MPRQGTPVPISRNLEIAKWRQARSAPALLTGGGDIDWGTALGGYAMSGR